MKLVTVFISCMVAFAAHAEIYKWVDANGKTHFTDKKPDAQEVEEIEVKVSKPSNDPDAQRRLQEMSNFQENQEISEKLQQEEDNKKKMVEDRKKQICDYINGKNNSYKNAAFLYKTNPDGSRKILNKEEREAAEKKFKKMHANRCK